MFTNKRQNDWDELLPLAEFQHNNKIHSSTKQTLFMLDTGQHPHMGFELHQHPSKLEATNKFKDWMERALEEAHAVLVQAQQDMIRYYDQKWRPATTLKPGDKVYLESNDIHTTCQLQKLSHRRLGPYKVLEAVRTHAYRLRLPRTMNKVHPVFPVIKLTPTVPDSIAGQCPKPPPLPVVVNGELEWEVEEILDSRMFWNHLQYLVKWKGYGREEASWEPKSNVHTSVSD